MTGVQANPVLIADATVPSGFSLVVSYSEAMKALPVPTITFTPDVSGTVHFTSGTVERRWEAVHGELQRYGRWGERFRNRGECERGGGLGRQPSGLLLAGQRIQHRHE